MNGMEFRKEMSKFFVARHPSRFLMHLHEGRHPVGRAAGQRFGERFCLLTVHIEDHTVTIQIKTLIVVMSGKLPYEFEAPKKSWW